MRNNHRLIRIKNTIISFGGYYDRKGLDSMYEYYIPSNKWEKMKVTMPTAKYEFGCTSSFNGP